jgi:hypothetical protein
LEEHENRGGEATYIFLSNEVSYSIEAGQIGKLDLSANNRLLLLRGNQGYS